MEENFKTARATRGELIEIADEQYQHMLNVLPPIYARGCFAMGEPVAHTEEGVTYYWASKRGERSFLCYGTRREAETAFARL